MSQTRDAPVDQGETYHVEIEELGQEGDGIGYVDGFVIFVPDTQLTESVDVEIETVRDSFAVGTVVERYD